MLNYIDVLIIVGSMLLVISVGVIAGRKKGDTAHGYFLGGNKMPWWIIGTAFVATGISSEQMIGTVGTAYEYGMGIANWEWFGLPCYTIALPIFIPIYLKNRVTTVPGFLSDRFGPAWARSTHACCWCSTFASIWSPCSMPAAWLPVFPTVGRAGTTSTSCCC